MLESSHNRVGVFYAIDVHEELKPGEWVRNDVKSGKPIADIINKFLETTGATVITVSPPQILFTAVSDDKKVRTYQTAVSIIYSPAEVIYDGTSTQKPNIRTTEDTADTKEIVFENDEIKNKGRILDAINKKLEEERRHAKAKQSLASRNE